MIKELILSLILLVPRHELNKDEQLLDAVVKTFEEAAEKYDIDPALLVVWIHSESWFMPTVVGSSRNEVGYAQVHGWAKKECKRNAMDPTTREGGIYCAAHLLRYGIDHCGDFYSSGLFYMSGKCKGTPRAKRAVKRRLRKWKKALKTY